MARAGGRRAGKAAPCPRGSWPWRIELAPSWVLVLLATNRSVMECQERAAGTG